VENSNQLPAIADFTWRHVLGEGVESLDQLDEFRVKNAKQVGIRIPKAGADAARRCLAAFRDRVTSYKDQRDFPAQRGTSQISIFLKNGSLTVPQVISELSLGQESVSSDRGAAKYLKELAWREFYYHILWHCPRVENETFIERYNSISWENREDLFDAWKAGKTGYPIVDAGMRQLQETGWMHNRVRMIVASFLVKDLHIDWRWGERFFMQQLLDGDLAPNNGGWQWAASTGCDPQPYFRVFNPTLQSEKFDPQGAYIKRWVPERAGLVGKALHEPIGPVVDHAARKIKVLAWYKNP
jgi:deoxyribodipyrimidine photo-lyase